MSFSVVDWVLVVILVLGGFRASVNGFFHEISYKLGYLLGFFGALMFSQDLALYIEKSAGLSLFVCLLISYVAIFLLGFILVAILGDSIQNLFQKIKLGFIDKLLGFVIGVFEALIVIVIVYSLLKSQKFFDFSPYFDKSWICNKYLNDLAKFSQETLSGVRGV